MEVEFVEDGVPCLTQRTLAPISPWHLVLGCIMLNQTHRRQARPALSAMLRLAPGPGEMLALDPALLRPVLLPCGLADRRLAGIMAMTRGWLDGLPPHRLPHTGDYAWDSHDIFVRGARLHPEDVGDHSLRPFLAGAWEGRWPWPPKLR